MQSLLNRRVSSFNSAYHDVFPFICSPVFRYVTFCMRRVSLLRHHGAKPIMVFDGASLPVKSGKHFERRRYVCSYFVQSIQRDFSSSLWKLSRHTPRLDPSQIVVCRCPWLGKKDETVLHVCM